MLSDVYDIYDTQIDKLTRHTKFYRVGNVALMRVVLLLMVQLMFTKLNALGMALNLMSGREVTNHYDHK